MAIDVTVGTETGVRGAPHQGVGAATGLGGAGGVGGGGGAASVGKFVDPVTVGANV